VKAVIVEAFGPVENAQVRLVADPLPGKGEVCSSRQLTLAEFGQAFAALHEGKSQGKIILTTHE